MSDDILSAYLREVKRGTRILVVAELHEPGAVYTHAPGIDPVLDGWARSGQVTMPTRRKEPLPDSPVVLPKGLARRLLRADRREARD
jgi:hypothetical protein